MTRYLFTDTATGSLQFAGAGGLTVDDEDDFDASTAETIHRESPWNDFFGTDEYVEFTATVAQPIVQPYYHDDELKRFRKSESELKRAQAQIDNLPWTMGHPPNKRVTRSEQIRGVWKDPEWDDGQQARLLLPANDTEAIRFAVQHGEVSLGFSGTLDYDTDSPTVDAVQREMAYDHIASVEDGRCPPEKGCGLHTDDMNGGIHGHVRTDAKHLAERMKEDEQHLYEREQDAREASRELGCDGAHSHQVDERTMWMPCRSMTTFESVTDGQHTDAVRTTMTEEMDTPDYSEGSWVEWDWSGGTAIGRVKSVSTEEPITVSGTTRDPMEEGEPVYRINHWDEDAEEFGNDKVAYESNLRSASTPASFTDQYGGCSSICSPGPCSCGLHDPLTDAMVSGKDVDLVPPEAAQNAAQDALDARDDEDMTVKGMTDHGWSRAEQLASGEELSPSDIVGSSGAMAPWWSRHATHTIEGGDKLSLAGSDMDNPWADNSYTAGKGWGGVTGYKWAIRKGNEIKRAMGEEPTYETVDAQVSIPNFSEGDMVRHRYIEDLRGRVAHNPRDRPYVMVDPIVEGSVNNHTMTFGTADIELVSKRTDDPMMDNKHSAPDGIYVSDGDWYGVAPSETTDDEPKYELNNCNDVKDAYNLRNNGDYDIDTSTLVNRIQRASEVHDCPTEQKPWVDDAKRLASFIANTTNDDD